ncbi:polysaccharide biosynthesis protein [Romboutsia sp.]|uniref:polysaccharide biosynthesis protein n=1 Tax=Romboutsia sp. TaxID=1965302 RepID=UPI003F2DEA5E
MQTQSQSIYRNGYIYKILNSYRLRTLILVLIDIVSILVAFLISLDLVKTIGFVDIGTIIINIGTYIIFHILAYHVLRCYSSLWKYAGLEEIASIILANFSYLIPLIITHKILGVDYSLLFYFTNTIFIITFTVGSRLSYRMMIRIEGKVNVDKSISRILVVGAGCAGNIVINEIKQNPQINKSIVGIVDDDIKKCGRCIHNIKILGNINDIEKIVKEYQVDEIIIAIAKISKIRKKEIINQCQKTKCKIKIIPGIYEFIDGRVDIKQIREVKIEDLLGREQIQTNLNEISDYITDEIVLVTGGGGSIGSELCRQISEFSPKQLIILDIYENNAYFIQQELIRKYGERLNIKIIIGNIRDENRTDEIFNKYRPKVVFHAAAHKHVPLMEESPGEAIKNNIFGTLNIAKLADKYKVRRMVLISTDKAVNPTNIMGATKRVAEMIVQSMNNVSETEYVAVRFGNVLGSNGSVIPLFKKQIEEGGPVTVTHPDIIRYFMTIPEAVGLVIEAGAIAKGGEIFVLDMGEPVKIIDLAKNLIKLSGLDLGSDIKIEYVGLRPGEKLYEELLMSEEGLIKTRNNKVFVAKPISINDEELNESLAELQKIINNEKIEHIDRLMKKIVVTYKKQEAVSA